MPTLRSNTILALCCLAFILVSVFYGPEVNGSFFLGAMLSIVVCATLAGPGRLHAVGMANPAPSLLAIAAIVILVISYACSLSRESSFLTSWILALVPLGYFVGRVLEPAGRQTLLICLSIVVLAFAALSVWMLITENERAHLPLIDPNSYGTLLYLVIIPWLYIHLLREWNDRPQPILVRLGAWLAMFILFAALFATQSRVGTVIIIGALSVYLMLAVPNWRRVRPVLIVVLIAAAAYLLAGAFHLEEKGFTDGALDTGFLVRADLNRAAAEVFFSYPITGAGVFVFPLLYRNLRQPVDKETAGLFVHNDYLQLSAEGGLFLGLIFVILAAAVVWRCLRLFGASRFNPSSSTPPPFEFGVLLAMGAALSQATVNFVVYTPVLALLLGILASMVEWRSPAWLQHGRWSRSIFAVGAHAGVVWAWVCLGFLALDTFSAGVFTGQARIPFAQALHASPERMFEYARLAETLNANRGLPPFVQAIHYQQRLESFPESDYLIDLTLDGYRRSMAADPWNTNVVLSMYYFVRGRPDIVSRLRDEEYPEDLLFRCIALDPIFVPGLEALIDHFRSKNDEIVAYRLLEKGLTDRLPWLAYADKQAALKFHGYLMAWARQEGDAEYLKKLRELGQQLQQIRPNVHRAWIS